MLSSAFRRSLLALGLAAAFAMPAHAETWRQPDLISVEGGYYDFDKDEPKTRAADFRGEYRWGTSLLPFTEPFGQVHPYAGFETNTNGMFYGNGGFMLDIVFLRNFVFTWSEGVGFYNAGDSKSLGSFIEFRSQAELGYRFDNDMRITGQISHISNAGLTSRNPGAEIAGVYFHLPVGTFFGR